MATQPHAGRIQKSGPPPHANSQRDRVLEILREAGLRGVNRAYFLFTIKITQVTARLNELEKMGYRFSSRYVLPTDQYCTYFLEHEPLVPLPLPVRGVKATHELCPHCGQTMPEGRGWPSTAEAAAPLAPVAQPPVAPQIAESGTHQFQPATLFEMGKPTTTSTAWRDPEQCG